MTTKNQNCLISQENLDMAFEFGQKAWDQNINFIAHHTEYTSSYGTREAGDPETLAMHEQWHKGYQSRHLPYMKEKFPELYPD